MGQLTRSNPLDGADPICRLSVGELQEQFAHGSLSPVEVAHATLARAEAINRTFNAFTLIDADGAFAAARASENRWRRNSPLSAIDGIPTTIKDIVWVEGLPVRFGSLTSGSEPVQADAPSVHRLRAAGAVILGLTATPEFGWKAVTDSPLTGVTRNPWNSQLTPGGSSGGAAVAAATGAGLLHLGTDGGGSIRIPSAFCGIVGIKPSFGRVPAFPLSTFGTVAHIGPMARRVDDAFKMLAVMSGIDHRDWTQWPGTFPTLRLAPVDWPKLRVGYWRDPPTGHLDPDVATAVDAAVAELASYGARVDRVTLPTSDLIEVFQTLWFAGAASRADELSEDDYRKLDGGLKEIIEVAHRVSAPNYVRAANKRASFGQAMDTIMLSYDILVSPGVAVLPFGTGLETPNSGLSRWTQWAGFSFPLNLSQHPAAVVPCGFTSTNLPVSLQIVGARGFDGMVLSVAKAFEQANPQYFL